MLRLSFSGRWVAVVATGVLASTVGLGTVWSYVRTAQHEVAEKIRDAVPIGFELKRLEQMTRDMIPEIQANQKVAAQLDVEVDYLQREVESLRGSQGDARSQMEKLRGTLDQPGDGREFGGRKYSRAEIEQDLDRRLERYTNTDVQLQAKAKLLETRQRTLSAATDKIRSYQRQYNLLVDKAESLQGELKLAELAANASKIAFDNSKLNQAKELSREVEKRIRIVQKLVEGQTIGGEIPVEADSRSVAERYDSLFGAKRAAKVTTPDMEFKPAAVVPELVAEAKPVAKVAPRVEPAKPAAPAPKFEGRIFKNPCER